MSSGRKRRDAQKMLKRVAHLSAKQALARIARVEAELVEARTLLVALALREGRVVLRADQLNAVEGYALRMRYAQDLDALILEAVDASEAPAEEALALTPAGETEH